MEKLRFQSASGQAKNPDDSARLRLGASVNDSERFKRTQETIKEVQDMAKQDALLELFEAADALGVPRMPKYGSSDYIKIFGSSEGPKTIFEASNWEFPNSNMSNAPYNDVLNKVPYNVLNRNVSNNPYINYLQTEVQKKIEENEREYQASLNYDDTQDQRKIEYIQAELDAHVKMNKMAADIQYDESQLEKMSKDDPLYKFTKSALQKKKYEYRQLLEKYNDYDYEAAKEEIQNIKNNIAYKKRHQELLKMNESAIADPDFEKYVKIGEKLVDKDSSTYEHMKKDERKLFAYYTGKDQSTKGGKYAEKYEDLMEETLNQRKGQEFYNEYLKGNEKLEVLYGAVVGLDQFANGIVAIFNTDGEYVPASSTQYAGQLAREDLADDGFQLPDWLGGASLGQVAFDFVSTTANMAPSILTSTVIGLINPAAGTVIGTSLLGASAGGNAYQWALNNGWDKSQARVYSVLVGTSEAALSALLSKAYGGLIPNSKALTDKLTKIFSNIESKYVRFALNYGKKYASAFLSEAAEESLQEFLTPFFENIALGYNKNGWDDIDWAEVLYSGFLGGLSGGMFEGAKSGFKRISSVVSVMMEYNTADKTQKLLKLALSLPTDSKANQLANKYNSQLKKNGKLSVNKAYNLVAATENVLTERLISLGETKNASAVASAALKAVTTRQLTKNEISLLASSKYGAEVLESISVIEEADNTQNPVLQSSANGENVQVAGTNNLNFETIPGESGTIVVKGDTDISNTDENKNTANDSGKKHFSLIGYSKKQIQNWKNSKSIIVYENEEQLRQFIRDAVKGVNLDKKIYFGFVSEELASRIKQETGIDVNKYNCTLRASEVRKILKDHGNEQNEALRGQRAITEDDFVMIPQIIQAPDQITLSDELFEGKPVIHFVKTINGKTTIAAYVSAKHLDLTVQTMYSGKNKGNLSIVAGEQAPANTPEANAGTVSNDIIGEKTPGVKNIISDSGTKYSENTENDSGEIGFREPDSKGIYRKSTDEETAQGILTGKRIDNKMRHINDIAKKLDSGLKIVWCEKNSDKLHGKNGKYVRETNTMYLAKDIGIAQMYHEVFKHEFVHRLESKKAYQSFQKYLFEKSKAFENYARAQLKVVNPDKVYETRTDVLDDLVEEYLYQVKNDKTLPLDIRKNFDWEDAKREVVADFVGETLFKGKENRADMAQALSEFDSEYMNKETAEKAVEGFLDAANKDEGNLDLFSEMATDNRNLLQKVIDAIKDFINNLKHVPQNKSLVEDLEYIEQRLSRVYASKDTKKAASQSGGVQYSTKYSFREQLMQMEDGTFDKEHSHLFVRADTPSVYLNLKEKTIPNLPIVMSYENAAVSLFDKNRTTKSDHNHGLGVKVMSQIPKYMEDPAYIVLLKNGRVNALLSAKYTKGRNFFISIELEVQKPVNPEYSGGYRGKQHLLLTAFGASKGYFEKILNNPENIILYDKAKDSASRGNPESKGLNIINDTESIDIIDENTPIVKNNISDDSDNYSSDAENGQFSSGSPAQQARENRQKYDSGEITLEEYLKRNDELWGKANEEFGMLPQGENAQAPIATPKAVAEDKPTERFTRTIIETGKLNDKMLQGMEEKVLLGDFAYKPISDETATKVAQTAINNGTAEDTWNDAVNVGKRFNKNQIAIGEQLLADAIKNGDTKRVLELSTELADVLTRAGQVVQAARLLKKMTGAGRLMAAQRMVKTTNNNLRKKYGEDRPPIKISEAAAKRLMEAKTQKGIEHAYDEILKEVAEQVPVTFLDKWNAWRYFAMLSNPKTHIRNVVGNAIFVPAVRIRYAMAVGMEQLAVKAGAIRESDRTKSLIVKKEYTDFAKKDGQRDEVKQLLKGNKYNDKSVIQENQRIFKNDVLEFLTQFNSNALEAEDMLFKNKHYIHALAGFLQSRGVDLNDVSEDILTEARIYAVNEARKATFNDESALANAIQNFGNKNLATNIMVEGILPFKRTPINIVKRGIEYSPIGLAKTLTKGLYDVKKGKITITEFIDGLAAGTTGTGIMLFGMFLASIGCITGGEDDDELSEFEKLLGKQEYSVEILGNSYSIDWAAPSVIPFFIGAEIVNTVSAGEDFSISKIGNAVWNSLEPITNLSMLSGIQGVIESARYSEPSQILAAIGGDVISTYAMQGIPSLAGALSRTIDPKQRSWYTDKNDKVFDSFSQSLINNVKSKIPGLSYTQIPKIDAWGREVSRGNVGERVLENFVSPGYYSKVEYDEVSEELKRIFVKTGANVFPKIADKSFQVNGENKQLTANEYVTYAKAKGEFAFDYIYEFLNGNAYKGLTDEERAEVIKNLYEYANAKAKAQVSDYDIMKGYKTVTNREKNGGSAVDYYVYLAIKKR